MIGRVPASVALVDSPGARSASPLGREVDLLRRARALGVSCLVCALFAPWIALLGPVRRILLAIVVLDIPLQIDTNLQHLDDPAELGALGGFNLSATTVALAGLYAAWLIDCLARRDRLARPSFGLVLPLGVYVLFVALSLVAAHDVGLYFRGLFLLLQMLLVFLYIVGSVRTRQDVRFVVMLLLCGLLLESLIIVGLSRTGAGFEVAGMTGRVDASTDPDGSARIGGTVGSPNGAAAYLSLLLAPAIGVLATNLGRAHKMVAVMSLGLGAVALLATQSRGGWLATGISGAIVCLALTRRRQLSLAVPILLLVFVSVLSLVFQERIAERLFGDDRGSALARVPLMATAMKIIITDNPVLGVGANNYTEALDRYEATFGGDFFYTVHNQYLLVWAETGVGGLAAFLWFLVATLRRGWARWTRADALLSPLALGFTAALMGHMVHMQVDLFNGRPQIQLLCLVAALIGVMSRLDSSSSRA